MIITRLEAESQLVFENKTVFIGPPMMVGVDGSLTCFFHPLKTMPKPDPCPSIFVGSQQKSPMHSIYDEMQLPGLHFQKENVPSLYFR